MVYILIILLTMVCYPLIIGFHNIEEFEFTLEVKDFKSEFYRFGLFFVEHSLEGDDEHVEQEFTISLYFVTLVFIFYKQKDL